MGFGGFGGVLLEFGFGAWRGFGGVLAGFGGVLVGFWWVWWVVAFGVWGHSFISLPEFRFADQTVTFDSGTELIMVVVVVGFGCSGAGCLVMVPFTTKGSPHAHNLGYH